MFKDMATVGFHCTGVGWNSSLRETPEQLRGLQNATRASITIVVTRKWVKFQYFVSDFYFEMGKRCEDTEVKDE